MSEWMPEIGSRVRIDRQSSPCHNWQGQLLWIEDRGYCVLVDPIDLEGNGVLVSPLVEVEISWLKAPRR